MTSDLTAKERRDFGIAVTSEIDRLRIDPETVEAWQAHREALGSVLRAALKEFQSWTTRTVRTGTSDRKELSAAIADSRCNLNSSAEEMLFVLSVSSVATDVHLINLPVSFFGFNRIAKEDEVIAAAVRAGLVPVPLEASFRLAAEYRNQPRGERITLVTCDTSGTPVYLVLLHGESGRWLSVYQNHGSWRPENKLTFARR